PATPPRRPSARRSATGAMPPARRGRSEPDAVTPAILINIDVDDLDRAVAFYASLLELKVGRSFGASGIELVGGSAPLYLLVKAAGTATASAAATRATGRRCTSISPSPTLRRPSPPRWLPAPRRTRR